MREDREPSAEGQDEPLFVFLRDDSPEILEATARARATVERFRELIASCRGDEVFHSAKLRFRDPGLSERLGEDRYFFVWLSSVEVDGAGFVGRTVQVPKPIDWLEPGQSLRFAASELYDWMVNDRGHVHGAYSLRVMRLQLPEHQRAAYDRYIAAESYE
jgi:uncharacterized protein YegJ (DUF2314 family)